MNSNLNMLCLICVYPVGQFLDFNWLAGLYRALLTPSGVDMNIITRM